MDGSDGSFERSLDMGAIALPDTHPGDRRDTLTARSYTHPALADRVVVRLATEPLGPAEDLVLDFLGFGPPAHPPVPVGVARRQALGFPAWVLVHDPANKRHALALVKEIERFSRLAATAPVVARGEFERVAAGLAASVPHFLPAYYEQAARAFLAGQNPGVAATMFGKAREAERTHGLDVEEGALTDAYVEFALAGAVTAKALSSYAKELSARVAPDDAHRRFRRVCVERIVGGLPPYTAMQADLRRLAKAAKLDQSAAEQDLLRELLPLPALDRAGQQFWDAYRPALVALARAEPAVRGRLLDHLPTVPGAALLDADRFWLDVLRDCGALDGLTEPLDTLPPEALLAGGAARWLADFTSRHGEHYRYPVAWPPPALLDLVRQMAPRLRAEGAPLRLPDQACLHVDLVDAYLAAGIEVADPGPGFSFLPAALTVYRAETPSDLLALEADPRFRPLLRAALDEFGWPALDEACATLTEPIGGTRLDLTEQWPYLIAADNAAVAVLGPDKLIYGPEHGQMRPDAWRVRIRRRWVGSRLSVTVHQNWRNGLVFWSGSPLNPLDLPPGYGVTDEVRPGSLELPDGSRSFGGRPYRAGDAECEQFGPVATDGERYWVLVHEYSPDARSCGLSRGWHEFDPFAGTVGEPGAPGFFADPAAPGAGMLAEACHLVPLPPGSDASPLGQAEGRSGWRTSVDASGAQTGTGVDGRTVRFRPRPLAHANMGVPALVGAIRFPGATEDLAIVCHGSPLTPTMIGVSLMTGAGQAVARIVTGAIRPAHARGTSCVAPWRYWHFLVPRDLAGSAALRSLATQTVRDLLDNADATNFWTVLEGVRPRLPQITDERLLMGVAGFVHNAAHCAGLLAALKAAAEPVTEPQQEPEADPEETARVAALAKKANQDADYLLLLRHIMDPAANPYPDSMVRTWSFGKEPKESALDGIAFFEAWRDLRTELYLAASAPWTGTARTDALDRARLLESSGLLALAGRVRLLSIAPDRPTFHPEVVATAAGHVVTFRRLSYYGKDVPMSEWSAVEITRESHAGHGFGEVPGWTVVREWRLPAWPWPETGPAEFDRLLAERGEPDWRPQVVERFADAAGLSCEEAALVLLGFPAFRAYDFEPVSAKHRTRFGFRSALAYNTAAWRLVKAHAEHRELLGELLPATAADLWTTGPDVERAAAWWVARHGRQVRVPGELLEAASAELRHTADWYSRTEPDVTIAVRDLLDEAGMQRLATRGDLDGNDYAVLVRALLWLAYRLPVGSELRRWLPTAARTLWDRMTGPGTQLGIGCPGTPEVTAELFGLPLGTDESGRQTVGPILFRREASWPVLLPCLVEGPGDPVLAWVDDNGPFGSDANPVAALRLLLGEDVQRLAQYGQPAEGVEPFPAQDPARSVPALVAEVADTLGLGPDAAALYLMLLALPDPTDRNQAAWTGWNAARLAGAREQLAATDLVVAGTRSRAGRGLFLPGPWTELRAPFLPVEAWKLDALGIRADKHIPLGVARPVVPVPEFFQAAWQRVRSGDGPRFQELSTGAGR
ncbi:MAG TPA: hypothetical protein VGX23_03680 [Actinocrinis sp.]|nr:hypothetical protein [Actinocrinis sp.]